MDRLNRGKNWREKNNGQDTLTAVLARSGEGLPNTEAIGKEREVDILHFKHTAESE